MRSHSIVRDRSCHTTLLHSQGINHVILVYSIVSSENTVLLCQMTEQERKTLYTDRLLQSTFNHRQDKDFPFSINLRTLKGTKRYYFSVVSLSWMK